MTTKPKQKTSILFVCLGNICRSPLAEAVFSNLLNEQSLSDKYAVGSCGTGDWHVGRGADNRTSEEAKSRGISLDAHVARQFCREDLDNFDLIVAMDRQNQREVIRLSKDRGQHRAVIRLLREFDEDTTDLDVPDPYYGGSDGFARVHDIIERCARELLKELESRDVV